MLSLTLRAGFLCLALAMPTQAEEVHTFRYRLDVRAEIGGQPYTASSVQEILIQPVSIPAINREGVRTQTVGEAAWLSLPGHNDVLFLVALNNGADASAWLRPCGLVQTDTPQSFAERVASFEGDCEIPSAFWPMMVVASDVADTTSFALTGPEDLTKAIGVKARVISVSLHATSEPLTTRLTAAAGWLSDPANEGPRVGSGRGIPIKRYVAARRIGF